MTSTPAPIEIRELTKRYGRRSAVDRLELTMGPGAIHCMLGRNGAGKSTTLETIMGLRNPTSGDVRIEGVSVRSPEIHTVRQGIGYLPEDPVLYDELTAREFLQFIAELHRSEIDCRPRIDALLGHLGMSADSDLPLRSCSRGMKKRVAFIAAVLPDPRILILDEPTAALDAASARTVKELMLELRNSGRLVLFTTHVMPLAEELADRLAILHAGRLVFEGTLSQLRSRHSSGVRESLEDLFLRLTSNADPPGSKDSGEVRDDVLKR